MTGDVRGEGAARKAVPSPEKPERRFRSFAEFYSYYLSEHANRTCRRLHFTGTTIALVLILTAIVSRQPAWILVALVAGYAFAWVGHFAFEKNRPATFRYPFYSFAGDWVMWKDMLTGRIRF